MPTLGYYNIGTLITCNLFWNYIKSDSLWVKFQQDKRVPVIIIYIIYLYLMQWEPIQVKI